MAQAKGGEAVSEDDINIAEDWLLMWETEIAEDESNDREMYDEDRKVILAFRKIIAVAKQATYPRNQKKGKTHD